MDETYVINQVKEDSCFVSQDFNADMEIAKKKGEVFAIYIRPRGPNQVVEVYKIHGQQNLVANWLWKVIVISSIAA